jgi:predicted nucleic acid-binding protein
LIQYLDTSLVVAALSREPKTSAVQGWMSQQRPGDLKISDWVITEFSAALSVKLRERQIDSHDRADALAEFSHLMASSLEVYPVLSSHFRTAARLAENCSLGLRGGDALHLAVAADRGAQLCTLDKQQAKAAGAVGVRATLL